MTKAAKPPREMQPRTVRVKPHAYQPKKAELEEPFTIRKSDGTMPRASPRRGREWEVEFPCL